MVVTEKTNFKINVITLITVLIFITSIVWGAAVWKTDFEFRLQNNENKTKSHEYLINKHHEVLNDQKIILARIQADISWIRLRMTEEYK